MDTSDLSKVFEKVYCVNLAYREDRWGNFLKQIPTDWPFAPIERYDAIDGKKVKPPDWFTAGGGAWGCYLSHLRILETALNTGVESILFLEDDALFCEDFTKRVTEFLAEVPDNWHMLYLGGQHLHVAHKPPVKITNNLYQPWNVNRTHAFAIQGEGRQIVYKHLMRRNWSRGHHIDHHLGRLHQQRAHRIYCPADWLVGQNEGYSNIAGRQKKTNYWPSAATAAGGDGAAAQVPFVAVIGLHSSGSSATAGVLYWLGVHMGNKFTGYYGNNPDRNCGFEAVELRNICERAIPFPATERAWGRQKLYNRLKNWINQKRREAGTRGAIAGGKYPQLCQMGPQLRNICGDSLRIIHIDRPIDDSVASLVKRAPNRPPENIRAHQLWLAAGKQELLASADHLTVQYYDLIAQPEREVDRIIEHLKLKPSDDQRARAIAYIKPHLRHVGAPAETEPQPAAIEGE